MVRSKHNTFVHFGDWQMDSLALGKFFLPTLQKLATRIPNLRCAVLCTPDGFNICSLGLSEDQVGKLAALSSSLLSVGAASVTSLTPEGDSAPELEMVTLQAGSLQIVGAPITQGQRRFVLMASAQAPLGAVIVGVKATSADIAQLL